MLKFICIYIFFFILLITFFTLNSQDQLMANWKTDFEVKFHLEFTHMNGKKECKYNSLIVEAENEDKAIEIICYQYENSNFLKIDEVNKIWKF